MPLTDKQRHVLAGLASFDESVTTRRLADRLEKPNFRTERFGTGEVRSQLWRLKRQGLVEKTLFPPVKWTPTDVGRQAL